MQNKSTLCSCRLDCTSKTAKFHNSVNSVAQYVKNFTKYFRIKCAKFAQDAFRFDIFIVHCVGVTFFRTHFVKMCSTTKFRVTTFAHIMRDKIYNTHNSSITPLCVNLSYHRTLWRGRTRNKLSKRDNLPGKELVTRPASSGFLTGLPGRVATLPNRTSMPRGMELSSPRNADGEVADATSPGKIIVVSSSSRDLSTSMVPEGGQVGRSGRLTLGCVRRQAARQRPRAPSWY